MSVPALVAELARTEAPRVLATLIRLLGDIDAAEEAVQEAMITALERWPVDGIPDRPGAWLTTTARNRALDRLRREARRDAKHSEAVRLLDDLGPPPSRDESGIEDDRLRLIFTCSHPALPPEARVALTLRTVAGLTTPEIARAFLVPEATVAQRIVRAKKKITAAAIPYKVPRAHELPDRITSVLDVVETVFTEGSHATSGEDLVRVGLTDEAVRLARLLADLMPDEPEVLGLLALLLATRARHPARIGGEVVILQDQDRALWDRAAIAEADALIQHALRLGQPGPRQLRAALACVHGHAGSWTETDWVEILGLYDVLVVMAPESRGRPQPSGRGEPRPRTGRGPVRRPGRDEAAAAVAPGPRGPRGPAHPPRPSRRGDCGVCHCHRAGADRGRAAPAEGPSDRRRGQGGTLEG